MDTQIVLKQRPELLKERLKQAPTSPGVYIMRGTKTEVIYVGKAKNLQNRLRSYFQSDEFFPNRTKSMVNEIFDFDLLTAPNEESALELECTLIKRYRPRYNVRLRDDKNYLYLKIPKTGNFPRIYTVRNIQNDKAQYFGPFTNGGALRLTLKTLRTTFPYRTCSDEVLKQGRVCLDYHIKRCAGPCEGLISKEDYRGLLDQVSNFMKGQSHEIVSDLKKEMLSSSENLEFEKAAKLRDRIAALEKIAGGKKVSANLGREQDAIGLAKNGGAALVCVMRIRGGQIQNSEYFELEGTQELEDSKVLNEFIGQYYANAASFPHEILISVELEDASVFSAWMEKSRGVNMSFLIPKKGRGKKYLTTAYQNAEENLKQTLVKKDYDKERTEGALVELQEALGLERLPSRIECFDISNIQGTNPVGAMVVFEDGKPQNSHYRKFHIKDIEGPNDFAMMNQMLRRRFGRAKQEVDDKNPDSSFGVLPDLVIIDGGKGQLSAARKAMAEMEVHQIATFGLAKRIEELFKPETSKPIMLPVGSQSLFLLQRIRDETHRFAVTFHRDTRNKAMFISPLDEVPGLGPKRKKELLKRFFTIQKIKSASLLELCEIVPEKVAMAILEHL